MFAKARMRDTEHQIRWEAAFQEAWEHGDPPSEAGHAADAVVPAGWLALREAARLQEQKHQGDLLRDVFGSAFRALPVIDSAWLTWNNGTVAKLAQAIYAERILPGGTLDNARLGVLADALEESGCHDAEILGHLRGGGTHVRGCFALDLLLGKR